MNPTDDWPRIGHHEVDPESLEKRGATLSLLVEELGFALDAETAASAPEAGWRPLRRHAAGAVLLGAPADTEDGRWHVATVQPGIDAGTVRVHPDAADLLPSRADQRRGLELRWPPLMTTGADLENVVIDVVNNGSTRWLPMLDNFYVVGVFTERGGTSFSYGWVASSRSPAVPLDPQDYSRERVHIDPVAWAELEPGDYDLHPVLAGLNLLAPHPLPITVSAEMIARHGARAPQPRRTPADRRESLERHIEQLNIQLSAGAAPAAIAEVVSAADTDQDAIHGISDLLGCNVRSATAVYQSSLQVLRHGHSATLRQQIDAATRELERM